jgi:hypothetical protein
MVGVMNCSRKGVTPRTNCRRTANAESAMTDFSVVLVPVISRRDFSPIQKLKSVSFHG